MGNEMKGSNVNRARRGTFNRLKPIIHHLYVEKGVTPAAIADHFNLNRRSLSSRLDDWQFPTMRNELHKQLLEELDLEAA